MFLCRLLGHRQPYARKMWCETCPRCGQIMKELPRQEVTLHAQIAEARKTLEEALGPLIIFLPDASYDALTAEVNQPGDSYPIGRTILKPLRSIT